MNTGKSGRVVQKIVAQAAVLFLLLAVIGCDNVKESIDQSVDNQGYGAYSETRAGATSTIFVSGPTHACVGTVTTFTVNAASAVWLHSSHFHRIGGGTGNTATFLALTPGQGWINVQVPIGGNTYLSPNPHNVQIVGPIHLRYEHIVRRTTTWEGIPSAGVRHPDAIRFEWKVFAYYGWRIEPAIPGDISMSDVLIRPISPSANQTVVAVRAHNACEWADLCLGWIKVGRINPDGSWGWE